MTKQGFSKIWIIVTVIILISGGILVWQLSKTPKIPGGEIKIEKELVQKTIGSFMDYRTKAQSEIYSYLPKSAKIIDLRYVKVLASFSRIILTAPDLKRYEVVQAAEISPEKLQFGVKSYLVKENKDLGYYDEDIAMEKVGDKYVVASFKQSEYEPLITDPCQDLTGEVRDVCYYRLAEETKNPEFCEKISPEWGIALAGGGRGECYSSLGVLTENSSLCEKAERREGWCYESIAVKEENETLCQKASDKSRCYYYLALKKDDSSLCSFTEDFPGTLGQTVCGAAPMRGEPARYYNSACKMYFTETKGQPFLGINGKKFVRVTQIEPNQEIDPSHQLFKAWSFSLDEINVPVPSAVAVSIAGEQGQKLYEGLVVLPNSAFCFEMYINPEYLKIPASKKGVIKISDGVNLEIPVSFR